MSKVKEGFLLIVTGIWEMIKGGFLREKDGRVAFTTEGFFVSNAVLRELLY